MQSIRRFLGEHWWGALAVLAAFIVVARTTTVGAPAQAHEAATSRVEPTVAMPASFERAVEASGIRSELACVKGELRLERSRSMLLERRYENLEARLDEVALLARSLTRSSTAEMDEPGFAPGEPVEAVPMPIEAIYIER